MFRHSAPLGSEEFSDLAFSPYAGFGHNGCHTAIHVPGLVERFLETLLLLCGKNITDETCIQQRCWS